MSDQENQQGQGNQPAEETAASGNADMVKIQADAARERELFRQAQQAQAPNQQQGQASRPQSQGSYQQQAQTAYQSQQQGQAPYQSQQGLPQQNQPRSNQNPYAQNSGQYAYQSGYHAENSAQQNYQSQRTNPGTQGDNGQKPNQTLAIIGMILGICAVVFCCIGPLSILFGIAAVICSIFAMTKNQTKGMWLTGIITGAVGIVLSIITIICLLSFFRMAGSYMGNIFRNYFNSGTSQSGYSQNGDLSNLDEWFSQNGYR